jgi:hypothetical protein
MMCFTQLKIAVTFGIAAIAPYSSLLIYPDTVHSQPVISQQMQPLTAVHPSSSGALIAEPLQLLPVRQHGKWGYIDRNGTLIIPPQFDRALNFSEGRAAVKLSGQWGYIDTAGKFAIPPTFKQQPGNFSEGLAWVKLQGKLSYINPQGLPVIVVSSNRDRWTEAEVDGQDFQDGRAEIRLDDGMCNWIDHAGKPINVQPMPCGSVFQEGLAAFTRDGKYGFIDRTGKLVIPAQFNQQGDDIFGFTTSSFHEGVAPVSQHGEWGYIDRTGQWVIPPQFDQALPFVEGIAAVQVKAGFGFINHTGKWVIPPQFSLVPLASPWLSLGPLCLPASSSPHYFSEGLAVVANRKQWGYIDPSGKLLIPPQFDYASDFHAGLAAVLIHGQWGYINQTGKWAISPQRLSQIMHPDPARPAITISHVRSGLAGVCLSNPKNPLAGKKIGFIDSTGKLIVPPQFDDAVFLSDDLIKVGVYVGKIEPLTLPPILLPSRQTVPSKTPKPTLKPNSRPADVHGEAHPNQVQNHAEALDSERDRNWQWGYIYHGKLIWKPQ